MWLKYITIKYALLTLFLLACCAVQGGGPNIPPTGYGCNNGSGGGNPPETSSPPGAMTLGSSPSGPAGAAGGNMSGCDKGCNGSDDKPQCCEGGNGGGPGFSGGNSGLTGGPTHEVGYAMPVWNVSEPYINLWVYDEPLGYNPGCGNRITFRLAYE